MDDVQIKILNFLSKAPDTYWRAHSIKRRTVEASKFERVDAFDFGRCLRELKEEIYSYADGGNKVETPLGETTVLYGEDVAYNVCPTMNWMTAWNFVKGLKERLETSDDATVVFVTDGGTAWLDPVQSFFPDAVHIRQFHSKNSRGIIYIHLRHDGKPYTVRFPWDVVLEEGEASDDAQRMRKRRKLEEDSSRSGEEWTELSDDTYEEFSP